MKTLILAAILVLTLNAKDRNWETGKVLDVREERFFNHGMDARPDVAEDFWIQGDTYTYEVEQPLVFAWNKPIPLTVNAPVKFVVKKQSIRLIDDNGNQYERGLYIVTRIQRDAK